MIFPLVLGYLIFLYFIFQQALANYIGIILPSVSTLGIIELFFGETLLNVYSQDPQQNAKACVIWMHGLGADASDMAGLAKHPALARLPVRHVFIDAPVRPVTINGGMSMRAWYDIVGVTLNDREDEVGIKQSQLSINQVIAEQIKTAGFRSDQIVLAGFSQGGAMALYSALHSPLPLAGVIALSAYLPLARVCQPTLPLQTPFFMGSGLYDPIVLPQWTKQCAQWLHLQGFTQITSTEYAMEHSICPDEIRDVTHWLSELVEGVQA